MTKQDSLPVYRKEIDGLRAFAVVAVIINHFNKDIFPGGYLGVDIFFVLSGYVITASLYRKTFNNFWDFIASFYERRIKRIIPTLIFFVIVTSILISFFNPSPQLSLRTGISSFLGLSNIYLLKQSVDYFASSTELNVFTHTWSLAVEEQFYFLFPILIWITGFAKKNINSARNLFLSTLFLTICSFICFVYFNLVNQPFAYFMMPSRFWEIAAGCLIFILLQKKHKSLNFLERLSPEFILIIIVLLMFLPVRYTIFATLGVVFLTTTLICCLRKQSLAYKLLTKNKVVHIGLISYSLYLWHWGILSLSRWTIGIHYWTIPFQIGLIFIISNYSYKWIENPFRKKNWSATYLKSIIKGLIALTISTLSLIFSDIFLKGNFYLGNKSDDFLNHPENYIGEFTNIKASDCLTSHQLNKDALGGQIKLRSNFLKNCYQNDTDNLNFISFIGDSHTLAIFPLREKLLSEYKFNSLFLSRLACAYPAQGKTNKKGCQEVMRESSDFILREINNNNFGLIVANSYLNSHFGYSGEHRKQFIYNKIKVNKKYVDKNLRDYVSELQKLAEKLKLKNSELIIFAPLPEHSNFQKEKCIQEWFRPKKLISKGCKKTSRKILEKNRSHIIYALNQLEKNNSNVYIFDSFDKFCDSKFCYIEQDGEILYSDDDHINSKGVDFIYPFFREFLDSKGILDKLTVRKNKNL